MAFSKCGPYSLVIHSKTLYQNIKTVTTNHRDEDRRKNSAVDIWLNFLITVTTKIPIKVRISFSFVSRHVALVHVTTSVIISSLKTY